MVWPTRPAPMTEIVGDIERVSITCSFVVRWRKLDVALARAGPYVHRCYFLDP